MSVFAVTWALVGFIAGAAVVGFFWYLHPQPERIVNVAPDTRPIIGVWFDPAYYENPATFSKVLLDNWPLRPGFVVQGRQGKHWDFIRGEITK